MGERRRFARPKTSPEIIGEGYRLRQCQTAQNESTKPKIGNERRIMIAHLRRSFKRHFGSFFAEQKGTAPPAQGETKILRYLPAVRPYTIPLRFTVVSGSPEWWQSAALRRRKAKSKIRAVSRR